MTLTSTAEIPVRHFPSWEDRPIQRDLVDGDPVMSHVVAVLSAMFPNGEDFFVRSVRHYRDDVDDPELAGKVKQFVGQESNHRRAHRELNERLEDLGYKTRVVDRAVGIGFKQLVAKVLPPQVQLAATAALEHYTATLAEVLLEDPEAQSLFEDEQIRRLLLWHALEESEHKAVAFDVYEAVAGNYLLRRAVMDATTAVFVGGLIAGTAYSAVSSASPGDVFGLARGLLRFPLSPFVSPSVLKRLRLYNRFGFHPGLFDSGPLIDAWRTRLFDTGEPGQHDPAPPL